MLIKLFYPKFDFLFGVGFSDYFPVALFWQPTFI